MTGVVRLHTLCPDCRRRLCYNAGWIYCTGCQEKAEQVSQKPTRKPFMPTVAGQVSQADYGRLQERIQAAGWSVSRFVSAAVVAALDSADAEDQFARLIDACAGQDVTPREKDPRMEHAGRVLTLGQKVIQSEEIPGASQGFIQPGRGAGNSGLDHPGYGGSNGDGEEEG